MKKYTSTFPAIAAFALMVSTPAFASQQPQTPPPADHPPAAQEPARTQSTSASGELVTVDTEAKTIAIKSAAGAEQTFSYDDTTEVTGAREGVAGLATKAGTRVTIEFTGEGNSKMATKITVEARDSQPKG